jgi:hypothetical protein
MAVKNSTNYPTVTPPEFIYLATTKGKLSVKEAIDLSGLSENSWDTWLYRGKTQTYRDVVILWLGSVCDRQQWL